jgi:hypothetical protein
MSEASIQVCIKWYFTQSDIFVGSDALSEFVPFGRVRINCVVRHNLSDCENRPLVGHKCMHICMCLGTVMLGTYVGTVRLSTYVPM